jgi:hypothetical protein
MTNPRIDFVARPRSATLGQLLLVAGLIALSALSLHGWTIYKAKQSQAQHASELAASLQRMTAKSSADEPRQANLFADPRWQAAAMDLRWPWQAMLKSIETATRPPVLLLAVRPNPGNGSLTLDGEAPNVEAALDYLGRLRQSAVLQDVQLLSHDEVTDTASGLKQTKFTIGGHWKGLP